MSTSSVSENVRVQWYRTPLDKATLAQLNAKSDARGLAQTLGYLGLLCATGGAAFYTASHWPWWTVLPILFVHGTFYAFMINGMHELVHKSVFKTQWLNQFFLRLISFLSWNNFEHFYASHMRHHQYTLHQPDDLEVVLPIKVMAQHFWKYSFINPLGIFHAVKGNLRVARGRFEGEWERQLFPADQPEKGAPTIRWARTLLVGHAVLVALSLYLHLWLLPVLTTLAPYYGTWLFFLCNNTQHVGLQDDVPDFRLCCRTFTLNPFVQFLYWHMNFHIEHHMYAAVPCYNLARLHRAILHDLPPCPHGLVATWQEIAAIQRRQAQEPDYQFEAPLPSKSTTAQPQPA